MTWTGKKPTYDWRKHLTLQEAKIISASDRAKKVLKKAQLEYAETFQRDRMIIVNRAIQRAKYLQEKVE